jgi:hypothetical protein
MLVVSNQLDFADVKAISVMSASRWLVKKGELQRLSWRDIDAPRLTFGRKIHKQTVYVFLFTDLLVITKRKGYELDLAAMIEGDLNELRCFWQGRQLHGVGLLPAQHDPGGRVRADGEADGQIRL